MKVTVNMPERTGMMKRAIAVAVLAFLCYGNNLGHDWAYDDHEYITENEFVTTPGKVADIFSTTYLYGVDGIHTGLYRPVTVFSYAVNTAVTGLRPSLFHLVNDLLHVVNSVLVLLVLTAFLGGSDTVFFAALLFAAHPLHTEAVTNIIGRAELLSFMFMMFSLLTYAYRERRRILYYPLSLAFFLLALMSKEIPAVLPAIILLDVLGNKARGEIRHIKHGISEAAGFFIVLMIYMLIRHAVISNGGTVPAVMFSDNPLVGMSFIERLPTAFTVVFRYTFLLVFPLTLSADYSYNQVPVAESWQSMTAIAGLVLAAAFAAVSVKLMKRSHAWYLGILLLGLPFVVVSNIFFTTGTIMGERLMYIPSLGFVLLLALTAVWLFRDALKRPRMLRWAMLLIVALYSGRTLARNPDWKDNETIFPKTAETAPNSVKSAYNYALVLRAQGRLSEAIDRYRHAVSIWPEHQRAWFNLGNTLSENGQYDEAVDAYQRALEILPSDADALHNLALTYKRMKQPEKAVEAFKRILLMKPYDLSVRLNIGTTWAEFGEYDKALAVFEENVRLNSMDAASIANIGNIYLIRGDTLRAESQFKCSLEIDPRNPHPNNMLLKLLLAQNRKEEAEEMMEYMRKNNVAVVKSTLDGL